MNKALDHYTCTGQFEFDSPQSFEDYIKSYQTSQEEIKSEVEYADNRN